jgi:HPt (histidine-containing phosphotransfer) domain-containing protein
MLDPLADLRARFAKRTLERIDALHDAIDRVGTDAEAPARIVELAHQLAGSAGTFGYAALSQAAASLEALARLQNKGEQPANADLLLQPFASIQAHAPS